MHAVIAMGKRIQDDFPDSDYRVFAPICPSAILIDYGGSPCIPPDEGDGEAGLYSTPRLLNRSVVVEFAFLNIL